MAPYYSDISLVMTEQFNASLKGVKSPDEAARDQELRKIVDSA